MKLIEKIQGLSKKAKIIIGVVVICVVVGLLIPVTDKETEDQENSVADSTSYSDLEENETYDTASESNLEEESNVIEEIPVYEGQVSFIIESDKQSVYGYTRTINQGTSEQQTFTEYRVPIGTYTIKNLGTTNFQIGVYSNDYIVNDSGYEETSAIYGNALVLMSGDIGTISVGDNQNLNLSDGYYKFQLVMQQ